MAASELDAAARDVTRLLAVARHGDPDAFNHLMPLVYAELRQIARRQLRRLRPGDTLDTTGLVHEAYIKLIDQKRASWQDRHHFFSIAARAMRQILVNQALRRQALKRGGGGVSDIALDDEQIPAVEPEAQLIALDAALARLEKIDARLSDVVECRFFGGLTEEEAAATLGVSLRTVQRDWKLARAWLQEELEGAG
jgi:RNA polymerase sigma factor (TIGR02999 family)